MPIMSRNQNGTYDEIPYPADQVYSAASTNAQSGVAVAQAVSGKANSSDLATVATSGSYNDLSNKPTIPTPVTVDQTYGAASTNAQSGVAIDSKKPGLKTTGTEYLIAGMTFVAGDGAEVFNNYSNNVAVGRYSHAEGYYTIALTDYSHTEGYYTAADGDCSHAEGYRTAANNAYSHTEGYYTTADADYSHAEGYYTISSSQYQHVQGKFNVSDSSDTYAFIIGNGTADNARHNAFAIDWNGLIYVNGSATGVDVAALAATIGNINSVLEEVL